MNIKLLFTYLSHPKLISSMKKLHDSNLFDVGYYVREYEDVSNFSLGAEVHYLLHGWKELRNPSADFNTRFYLEQNSDVKNAGINPLLHYIDFGKKEGRLASSPSLTSSEIPSTAPVIEANDRAIEAIQTSPSTIILKTDKPPLRHISNTADDVVENEMRIIESADLFNEEFYRRRYPDVKEQGLRHYCRRGWKEGKDPSDEFQTNFYLATYTDIAAGEINPLWHFAIAGKGEGRLSMPATIIRYEDNIEFGDVNPDVRLLAFYVTPVWSRLQGQPGFKGHMQPVAPAAALGNYDVGDPAVLQVQARLAKDHGIHAFVMSLSASDSRAAPQPIITFLSDPSISIGLCVQVELSDTAASPALMATLVRALKDPRIIKIGSDPVVVVHITTQAEAATEAARLRDSLSTHGIPNAFLIGSVPSSPLPIKNIESGGSFDAVVDHFEFIIRGAEVLHPSPKNGIDTIPYPDIVNLATANMDKDAAVHGYRTVSLPFDNTPAQSAEPLVHTQFHLADYRRWLEAELETARMDHAPDRRFVFINAWNDWNRGLFLEPDQHSGHARLNETTRTLLGMPSDEEMPRITVIVPNYRHAKYLHRRLDSIYNQSYKNIEVLLLDDCSPDHSRDILDEYQARYPKITRTLYNSTNSGGPFRQWAKGISEASGDLIWIAESDDYCEEQFLEKLVRCFDDEAVLLAYGHSVFVNEAEEPLPDEMKIYLSDLEHAAKWEGCYVDTAHIEVRQGLGIKNTIPNASSVLFRKPVDMPLLADPEWLSMSVAGDWVFYLHVIRGGKVAYRNDATNFFRRYPGSTAEATYRKEVFYREVGIASRTVASLYDVPLEVLERCVEGYRDFYSKMVNGPAHDFTQWYDFEAVLAARDARTPAILVSTMGFSPGGAEILPIRMANEFKRQGHSVLLLSANLNAREDGIRRMLRNDVPLVETSSVEETRDLIRDFGIEALNSHQWHVQKYPLAVEDVFSSLRSHVASLHGMIEHGEAFETTAEQVACANEHVTTWVYTADKNLEPFVEFGLYEPATKFVKIPNGLPVPAVDVVSRSQMNIPDDAFVLCCVSRAIPDKGWAEAIEAVSRARELSSRDIRLILVGNGPVYDAYCRSTIPAFVHLAGFSKNSGGYYAAADMGIMLTTFKSESFPLTIIDCLFSGRPYIASDVGDIRNMLTYEGHVAGEVIPLKKWKVQIEQVAQAIATLSSDPAAYERAAAWVPTIAKRYQIDMVASQYVTLFENDMLRSRDAVVDITTN